MYTPLALQCVLCFVYIVWHLLISSINISIAAIVIFSNSHPPPPLLPPPPLNEADPITIIVLIFL